MSFERLLVLHQIEIIHPGTIDAIERLVTQPRLVLHDLLNVARRGLASGIRHSEARRQ